jgi:hypothetical protein
MTCWRWKSRLESRSFIPPGFSNWWDESVPPYVTFIFIVIICISNQLDRLCRNCELIFPPAVVMSKT